MIEWLLALTLAMGVGMQISAWATSGRPVDPEQWQVPVDESLASLHQARLARQSVAHANRVNKQLEEALGVARREPSDGAKRALLSS